VGVAEPGVFGIFDAVFSMLQGQRVVLVPAGDGKIVTFDAINILCGYEGLRRLLALFVHIEDARPGLPPRAQIHRRCAEINHGKVRDEQDFALVIQVVQVADLQSIECPD